MEIEPLLGLTCRLDSLIRGKEGGGVTRHGVDEEVARLRPDLLTGKLHCRREEEQRKMIKNNNNGWKRQDGRTAGSSNVTGQRLLLLVDLVYVNRQTLPRYTGVQTDLPYCRQEN